MEQRSEHPLGEAIVAEAKSRNLDIQEADRFSAIAGKGVKAIVEGKNVLVGNSTLFNDENISWESAEKEISDLQDERKNCNAHRHRWKPGRMVGSCGYS